MKHIKMPIYYLENRIGDDVDRYDFEEMADALEESKNKIIIKLPVGSVIVANNYFWLHGRKPFKENKDLSRELLRIRGSIYLN